MEDVAIEKIVVGPLMTNCYIVSSGKDCIIIDPGAEGERIVDYVLGKGLNAKYVLATHGHFDHVSGIAPIRKSLKAEFHIHSADLEMFRTAPEQAMKFAGMKVGRISDPDGYVEEKTYGIGNEEIVPVHTPGHTAGSTSFMIGENMFSGDTLFNGSIGRMDFGGSEDSMKKTIEMLKGMDDSIRVYPGHGPSTTIGDEKNNNPFFTYYRL